MSDTHGSKNVPAVNFSKSQLKKICAVFAAFSAAALRKCDFRTAVGFATQLMLCV